MSDRHGAASEHASIVPGSGPTATADFHAHTTRSDGVLEPPELVRQAAEAGVRLFSITDHDNLAGYRELRASGFGEALELVPGVEINAVTRGLGLQIPGGELHILGLEVDADDEAFEAALASQRAARRARFEATLERLRDAGIGVDAQVEALDLTRDDALGRPTVARALVAAGHATSVEDAFERILGYGMPGYVPRQGLGPVEAIRAIRAAGGLASLAHFSEAPTHLPLLRDLRAEGLNGIESHHRSFDAAGAPERQRRRPGARSREDGRDRLPRRPRPVRRGARRARDAGAPGDSAPGRHRALTRRRRRSPGGTRTAGTTMGHRMTTRALPVLDIAPPVTGPAGPRDPLAPVRRAAGRVPPRGPLAAVVLRLDARLPDEQERLRGDGRAPAGRRLRGGARDGRRRPRRHQHLRDPGGGRGQGHRAPGRAQPPEGGEPRACAW